jgi:phosphatidylserine decarboxylase
MATSHGMVRTQTGSIFYHAYMPADFFTRQLKDSARPVASPDDDNVVANCCESKVYNHVHDVKLRDKFFAKGQPYSVLDMLGHDPLSKHFAGGTIYQAFLSALSYHRWHSPVSGVVKRAFVVEGTYFSEPLFSGLGDPSVQDINPENPAIGLVAFVGIGMDEVSTCDITVKEGQHIKKGDETGMFHFGGSSHCVLFQKGTKLEGFPKPGREENVPVRSKLATVSK